MRSASEWPGELGEFDCVDYTLSVFGPHDHEAVWGIVERALTEIEDLIDDDVHMGAVVVRDDTADEAASHTKGANAEDCRACDGRTDLDYPFICDGGDDA